MRLRRMDRQVSPIQIYIFVPWATPYEENWVEQVLGEIVLPVIREYSAQIEALWVTRYIDSMSKEPYEGVNPPYLNQQEVWRHVKLRLLLKGEISLIKSSIVNKVHEAACIAPIGWQNYDLVGDLGKSRFINAQAGHDARVER